MQLLTAGMQGVANVEITGVHLVPTLAGFELVFSVAGQTVTLSASHWLVAHSAEVQIGGGQGPLSRLGVARPPSPLRLRTASDALMVAWEFRLPVTAHQLAVIEEVRDSGDLQIKLVISGEGGPDGRPEQVDPVHKEFYRRLGKSDWISDLNAAKAMDILLLEIPMPFVNPPKERGAVTEALRSAQRLFVEGNYPECVARCRTAIEALATLEGRLKDWSTPAFEKLKPRRGEMTKDERELMLEASLLHFAHLGAHPNEVEISRREAKLAIVLTASILTYRLS